MLPKWVPFSRSQGRRGLWFYFKQKFSASSFHVFYQPKDNCYSNTIYVSNVWFNLGVAVLVGSCKVCIEISRHLKTLHWSGQKISVQDVIRLHRYKMELLVPNVDFQPKDKCYSNTSYISIVWINLGAAMLVCSGKVLSKISPHFKSLHWSANDISGRCH